MSLLELLQDAYSKSKNFQDIHFIPYEIARQIVTRDQIDRWSKTHPLCLEHGHECPQRIHLTHEIPKRNIYIFVVLVFAELEFLIKEFIASGSRDVWLFDTKYFERLCDSARLSAEQKQALVKYRSYVGVRFASGVSQDIPRDAVLPFTKRESLDRYGSYGVLYRVKVSNGHLRGYDDTVFIAEKRIRPMTNPSQGDWNKLFREVWTLQRRSNHPNIIPLLASYTLETDESGNYVKSLHLLFPLADMDLADWMAKPHIPSNVTRLSKQNRQLHLYRSIYALVSGVSYLHRDVDGYATAHHDLKPRNILVVNDKLKIADFGHSHLRPILEGSATEGVSGLGTYEYQPPEYWNQDGSQAQIKHGRPFDVWAVGCIIVELAILIVHDWQSEMVKIFRNERNKNPNRDRKSPDSVQDGSECSFHNNRVVVEDWVLRLKTCSDSQPLNEVLNIATGMLAPNPSDRPYMWEIQMDLYETLKPYDISIPNLEGDLCVPPLLQEGNMKIFTQGGSYYLPSEIGKPMETPLHRAAKRNNRSRTIRLWELGWSLSHPDSNGETPRDIIKASDHLEIWELESMVTFMLEAAKGGNVGEIEKLISRGLSPLMIDADGRSALYEAVIHFQVSVVEYLMNGKWRKNLLELWHEASQELPLHTAASIGFVEALDRILKDCPDINIHSYGKGTALYLAAENGHIEAVRLLLKNKAKVLPFTSQRSALGTPVHAALSKVKDTEACEIVKLLLQADSSHECMEHKDGWGLTPLLLAAFHGQTQCFEILLQHGASVHASYAGGSLLRIIATSGGDDILRQCIEKFSLEELEDRSYVATPSEQAQEAGHKEVAKLLRSHIRQVRRSAGKKSGILGSLRSGLDHLKR